MPERSETDALKAELDGAARYLARAEEYGDTKWASRWREEIGELRAELRTVQRQIVERGGRS